MAVAAASPVIALANSVVLTGPLMARLAHVPKVRTRPSPPFQPWMTDTVLTVWMALLNFVVQIFVFTTALGALTWQYDTMAPEIVGFCEIIGMILLLGQALAIANMRLASEEHKLSKHIEGTGEPADDEGRAAETPDRGGHEDPESTTT
jgi:hypothetical protein